MSPKDTSDSRNDREETLSAVPDSPPTLEVARRDPIPSGVAEVIELFSEELAGVIFPQVDQHRLEEQATAARELSAELERLEEQVALRTATLKEALDELEGNARRGLAYAKIYAEGDESLAEHLGSLELAAPPPPRVSKAPRKRRQRKAKATEGEATDQHLLLVNQAAEG